MNWIEKFLTFIYQVLRHILSNSHLLLTLFIWMQMPDSFTSQSPEFFGFSASNQNGTAVKVIRELKCYYSGLKIFPRSEDKLLPDYFTNLFLYLKICHVKVSSQTSWFFFGSFLLNAKITKIFGMDCVFSGNTGDVKHFTKMHCFSVQVNPSSSKLHCFQFWFEIAWLLFFRKMEIHF